MREVQVTRSIITATSRYFADHEVRAFSGNRRCKDVVKFALMHEVG
jgi:hypothetical protein